MVSHEIDYRIFGDDIQFVEVDLDPGETVIAEAGTMVYMEQGIAFDVKMGDGSEPDQSLSGKLIRALAPHGPNSRKEAGSVLGGLFQ
jgi:uncharacterized protein (AIM24 family)